MSVRYCPVLTHSLISLKTVNSVSADYDKITEFFEDLNSYLEGLKIFEGDVPSIPELKSVLSEVLVSVLDLCGIYAKYIKTKRIGECIDGHYRFLSKESLWTIELRLLWKTGKRLQSLNYLAKALRNLISGEDDELKSAYARFHKAVEKEKGIIQNATLAVVTQHRKEYSQKNRTLVEKTEVMGRLLLSIAVLTSSFHLKC